MKTLALFERFAEPSSWAGIGIVMSLFGAPVGLPEIIIQAGAGVAGLLAFVLKERAR